MLKDLYYQDIALDVKGKGQILTPDFIVDYMCNETMELKLKEFDRASRVPILILDPACGSGRFMLGIKDWCDKNDFHNYLMFNIDIDERMVEATVKHAEHYKIPAIVILGNALLNDFKKAWHVNDGVRHEIPVEPIIKWFERIGKGNKADKEGQTEFDL